MSAIEMPTRHGKSSAPVMDTTPASLYQEVACFLRCTPGCPVAGDVADDHPRMRRTQSGSRQSKTIGGAGRQVLHEDVGALEQLLKDVACGRVLEINRQRFLRSVQPDEMCGQSFDTRVGRPQGSPSRRSILITRAPRSAS